MKDSDRKKILDALIGNNIPPTRKGKELRKILENCCLEDLNAIEPIIDDIVQREILLARGEVV